MAISVFLSVGRPFNEAQEGFVKSIEAFLGENGLRPRTVGRSDFTHKQPLQLVDELMSNSAGALVLALQRISIEIGNERGGPPSGATVQKQSICTPWNQIEAAFAYAKRVPLLVIKEDSVRAEGLLEGRYDWYVHATPLNTQFLSSQEFKGTFDSWRRDVKRKAGWFRHRA